MAHTIIANLPTTSEINPQSFVIIERPGIGQGTYKSTVGDLQEAITVHANVIQEDNITRITVTDINGTTQAVIFTPLATVNQEGKLTTITITDLHGTTTEQILTPTAKIVDNGDNTATITITDTEGTTEDTIISRVILDEEPTEDSPNFLTSGVIYAVQQALSSRIDTDDTRIDDAEARIAETERRLNEAEQRIAYLEDRLTAVEIVAARALVVGDDQELEDPFLVNGQRFDSLKDAILDAAETGGTVRLLSNASSSGISIPGGKEFTLDLNGFDLEVTGPGAGSPGTETLGMQLLMGSDITIKNGSINFDDNRLRMGIQNYCNLTLDNVQLTGGPTIFYVVSNNHGNVVFKNGTTITASAYRVAFDCWYGLSAVYDDGVNITIEDDSVQINGKVEFGKQARASAELFAQNASITCPSDIGLNVTLLNTPCEWTDNGDGSKTLRYVYTPA